MTKRDKVAVVLCVLASLSFLVVAIVVFIQEGDWPAKYISAAVTILAVMFIAMRRRSSSKR